MKPWEADTIRFSLPACSQESRHAGRGNKPQIIALEERKMKVKLTCSDCIQAFKLDYIVMKVENREQACSEETWNHARKIFARRHKTRA